MNWSELLNSLVTILIVVGLAFALWKYQITSLYRKPKDGQDLFRNYQIHLRNNQELPADFATNPKIAEKIHVYKQLDDAYFVSSSINQGMIRDLLSQEYGIAKKDLVVTTGIWRS